MATEVNQKKKRRARIIFSIIFLIGLAILLFPFISQYQHRKAAQGDVEKYQSGVEELSSESIDERMFLARAYNDALFQQYAGQTVNIEDPYTDENHADGIAEYAHMLEVSAQIGVVSIPKIAQELPVFAGTSEKVLQRGVGHMEGTSLPVGGENTHSVITAHRGLPNARLFTDLDELEIGDQFYFQNISETLAYEVDSIEVIEPHEIEYLDIVPGEDYMTLLTCTPYMINSHRLLVRGHRIPYSEEEKEAQIEDSRSDIICILLILLLILLIILLIYLYYRYRKNNEAKEE